MTPADDTALVTLAGDAAGAPVSTGVPAAGSAAVDASGPVPEPVAPPAGSTAAGDGARLTDLAGSWDRRVRTAKWGARSARG
ncbi:hypothetical protein BL253_07795 [Pseudofrankia asymbiotica]|uniref:Uncharacterized protein n=1 Tax=Pseudofrankia asymbiotica TaxID=1834516 RepID=A0A1V2IGG5_9ACTN|nr:hypothetical protein BL253_07795 [Pseudofrankia asymbiotica]